MTDELEAAERRVAALEAMAGQSVSPNEAKIAEVKLARARTKRDEIKSRIPEDAPVGRVTVVFSTAPRQYGSPNKAERFRRFMERERQMAKEAVEAEIEDRNRRHYEAELLDTGYRGSRIVQSEEVVAGLMAEYRAGRYSMNELRRALGFDPLPAHIPDFYVRRTW